MVAEFFIFGYWDFSLAIWKSCGIESTCVHLDCLSIPLYTPAGEANAAVCEEAAFCPKKEFPDFRTMIGFLDFLQVWMNFCPRASFRESM